MGREVFLMASITKPEKAVRLARAIASISAHNEERIIEQLRTIFL